MTSKSLCLIKDLISLIINLDLLGNTGKKAGMLYKSSFWTVMISAFIMQIQKVRRHDIKTGMQKKRQKSSWEKINNIKWLLMNWIKDEVLLS